LAKLSTGHLMMFNNDPLNLPTISRLEEYAKSMKEMQEKASALGQTLLFKHSPTSGAIITINIKQGTYLIGAYPKDLKFILSELGYAKTSKIGPNFSPEFGQKVNLLNVADGLYQYYKATGGFFVQVNGPWVDSAVLQGMDIICVTDPTAPNSLFILTEVNGKYIRTLTGFGKEVHRLEWKFGYRYDPSTKHMVPNRADKPTLTKKEDNSL
jgi:hypothetical protein